jgi:glycine betaine/proline transport system substrate-binding protein
MHWVSLETIIIGRAGRRKGIGMSAPRYARPVLASIVLLLALWLMVGCGGKGSDKTLDIADIGWTENTAISGLTQVLLEEDLGYKKVTIHTSSLDSAFDGVANGSLDAFQDVWLPNQQNLLDSVKDDVELLDPWYQGQTKQGIGVPSYTDTTSLDQLNESNVDLIYGIEPSSVVMQKVFDKVIPSYGLHQKLVAASTDGMLAEVDNLYRNREDFAFLAWSPHWMNQRYDIRYLEDPKDAFGELNNPAKVSTLVKKALRYDDPVAYAFMKAMTLDEEQIDDLESTINDVGDPLEGARQWANDNRDVVQPWIDAAENVQED